MTTRRLTYQDEAKLEYGRLLWRNPEARARLLGHWTDARHPHAERFSETWRPWVEMILTTAGDEATGEDDLDSLLRVEGLSLRVVAKEIPPVFGSFY